jgi:RNA exonuclease 1
VLPIVALDCELVYTTAGMSLARLTVVDDRGDVVLDEFVRPHGVVLDYNTKFSGVKHEDIEGGGKNKKEPAVLDLQAVRQALGAFISEQTIIVGHGLENDLKALRIVHDRVIDTTAVFPHHVGLPIRHALRNLAKEHLKIFIQDGDATVGHDSKTDAVTALELVRFKMKQLEREDTAGSK